MKLFGGRHNIPQGQRQKKTKPKSWHDTAAKESLPGDVYLFRMTRACIVHGRYRKALSPLTASTVFWATTSGLRGGKSWGNLRGKCCKLDSGCMCRHFITTYALLFLLDYVGPQ